MDWKWWTKVSGISLFIIAISNFYLGNFHSEGPVLEFKNLPSSTQLDSLNLNSDLSFTFYLYNKGDTTGYIEDLTISKSSNVYISSSLSDNTVPPGEDVSVLVTLSSPGTVLQDELSISVLYDDQIVTSDSIPFSWGKTLN